MPRPPRPDHKIGQPNGHADAAAGGGVPPEADDPTTYAVVASVPGQGGRVVLSTDGAGVAGPGETKTDPTLPRRGAAALAAPAAPAPDGGAAGDEELQYMALFGDDAGEAVVDDEADVYGGELSPEQIDAITRRLAAEQAAAAPAYEAINDDPEVFRKKREEEAAANAAAAQFAAAKDGGKKKKAGKKKDGAGGGAKKAGKKKDAAAGGGAKKAGKKKDAAAGGGAKKAGGRKGGKKSVVVNHVSRGAPADPPPAVVYAQSPPVGTAPKGVKLGVERFYEGDKYAGAPTIKRPAGDENHDQPAADGSHDQPDGDTGSGSSEASSARSAGGGGFGFGDDQPPPPEFAGFGGPGDARDVLLVDNAAFMAPEHEPINNDAILTKLNEHFFKTRDVEMEIEAVIDAIRAAVNDPSVTPLPAAEGPCPYPEVLHKAVLDLSALEGIGDDALLIAGRILGLILFDKACEGRAAPDFLEGFYNTTRTELFGKFFKDLPFPKAEDIKPKLPDYSVAMEDGPAHFSPAEYSMAGAFAQYAMAMQGACGISDVSYDTAAAGPGVVYDNPGAAAPAPAAPEVTVRVTAPTAQEILEEMAAACLAKRASVFQKHFGVIKQKNRLNKNVMDTDCVVALSTFNAMREAAVAVLSSHYAAANAKEADYARAPEAPPRVQPNNRYGLTNAAFTQFAQDILAFYDIIKRCYPKYKDDFIAEHLLLPFAVSMIKYYLGKDDVVNGAGDIPTKVLLMSKLHQDTIPGGGVNEVTSFRLGFFKQDEGKKYVCLRDDVYLVRQPTKSVEEMLGPTYQVAADFTLDDARDHAYNTLTEYPMMDGFDCVAEAPLNASGQTPQWLGEFKEVKGGGGYEVPAALAPPYKPPKGELLEDIKLLLLAQKPTSSSAISMLALCCCCESFMNHWNNPNDKERREFRKKVVVGLIMIAVAAAVVGTVVAMNSGSGSSGDGATAGPGGTGGGSPTQPVVGQTQAPTSVPTRVPTTHAPTTVPTAAPTSVPTSVPTQAPTAMPTRMPTARPTLPPTRPGETFAPTTLSPTAAPTRLPTHAPTRVPTTVGPTDMPTDAPTSIPTYAPTVAPTAAPTAQPTARPTFFPTAGPSNAPTHAPTAAPTARPTFFPTARPTNIPTTASPSLFPTTAPPSTAAPTNSAPQSCSDCNDLTGQAQSQCRLQWC
ncbi:MAG: hypothetical protein K0U23_02030 [Gammaproteobacteria bacterium]|nr:hypothetical protein [Gammaproteobacteria bacterium]